MDNTDGLVHEDGAKAISITCPFADLPSASKFGVSTFRKASARVVSLTKNKILGFGGVESLGEFQKVQDIHAPSHNKIILLHYIQFKMNTLVSTGFRRVIILDVTPDDIVFVTVLFDQSDLITWQRFLLHVLIQ